MPRDLALVMPVYNEQDCIARVVREWAEALEALGIDFLMIVLNDGSRDGTADALAALADHPRVRIVDKPNSGHGPTVLMGYRQAVAEARWVFQTDSDDELPPEAFAEFWQKRTDYDGLFAIRGGRVQAPDRKIVSAVSRLVVRLLFGRGVRDVNVPFRLIRARLLERIVADLPDDTLTPNIIVSGALNRAGARIANLPVAHRERQTGEVSLGGAKLWRFAAKAFVQCLRLRPRLRCADLQAARQEEESAP